MIHFQDTIQTTLSGWGALCVKKIIPIFRQTFPNIEFRDIQIILDDKNEPWFVGKDVAEKLGYSNTKGALVKHVDLEDKQILQKSRNATFEIPTRGLTIINESGLYTLSLSSKMPSTIVKITGSERRAGTPRKTDR